MKTAERALEYYQTFERAGKPIVRMEVEGRVIRLIFKEDAEATGLTKNWSSE